MISKYLDGSLRNRLAYSSNRPAVMETGSGLGISPVSPSATATVAKCSIKKDVTTSGFPPSRVSQYGAHSEISIEALDRVRRPPAKTNGSAPWVSILIARGPAVFGTI